MYIILSYLYTMSRLELYEDIRTDLYKYMQDSKQLAKECYKQGLARKL